jgi:5,10-methylenetetrahydromethanopterin reductase
VGSFTPKPGRKNFEEDKEKASMAMPFRIGVLQLSMEPTDETVRMAKACEDAGFDSFWLAEAYPWWRKHSFEARSSTAVTALVARETRRVPIGWGIISPYTRHPVQIAMEARVMQDIAGPGRFFLGLGASKIFMKEIGEGEKGAEASPATVMRESTEIIRGALSGEAFRYAGKSFDADIPPLRPDAHVSRERLPLYFGATGPVLQRMAGEIADGLLTASITTPEFSRYARGFLEEGARKAGRDPSSVDLGGVIVGSIGRDKAHASDGAREMAAMYLANKVQNIRGSADMLLNKAGLTFDEIRPIAEGMEQGGRKQAARAVTDEILSKVKAIAGTPDQCIERIEEYRQAGCTHILLEIWGEDRLEQAKLFGEAVLPHFQQYK